MLAAVTLALAAVSAQAPVDPAEARRKRPPLALERAEGGRDAARPPDPTPRAKGADDDPLVDATVVVPDLVLDIRYATPDNFMKARVYDAAVCWLRAPVAARLAAAQAALKKRGFRLKAFDCYRPLSVQQVMWDKVPVRGLVAPPSIGGSNHNRGTAVDVSLLALDGSSVEMPTGYDDFSKAARVYSTLPTRRAQRHRAILQKAMTDAGFALMNMEWWHFDAPEALDYRNLDVPLSALGRR